MQGLGPGDTAGQWRGQDLNRTPVSNVWDLSRVSPFFYVPGPKPRGHRNLSAPEGASQKGVLSFAGMAGLPGRLGDTQHQGLVGSSGALSTVLPRATGAAI